MTSMKIIIENFFSTFAALCLAAIFFAPVTMIQAANPTSGAINPTVGSTVTWRGTAPGGASPDGETTCVEGVNCDTFTLTVSGSPADWTGKLIKVKIDWTIPAHDYDLYIHKDSVTGPEVSRSGGSPPIISEMAEIKPGINGTGFYAGRVVYLTAV